MKGLLYKDFYVLLKQNPITVIIILIMALVNNAFSQSFMTIFVIMLPLTALSYDEQARWDTYAAMMPYKKRDLVLSKYVLGLLLCGGVFALELISAGVFYLIKGSSDGLFLEEKILFPLGVMAGALIFLAISLPIIFKLGVEKGRLVYIILCFAVAGLIGASAGLDEAAIMKISVSVTEMMTWLVLAATVVMLVSIRISIAIYEKKEF